jgi:hypothetical protein
VVQGMSSVSPSSGTVHDPGNSSSLKNTFRCFP